jgi:hypothetical protein
MLTICFSNLHSARRNANQPDNRNHNIGFRLAGALLAGGTVNQQHDQFRYGLQYPIGQIQGLRCVSWLSTQSLPSGHFFS